jgi:hypothetical protein
MESDSDGQHMEYIYVRPTITIYECMYEERSDKCRHDINKYEYMDEEHSDEYMDDRHHTRAKPNQSQPKPKPKGQTKNMAL